MKFILLLLLMVTTVVYAQDFERCSYAQNRGVLRLATSMCNEQVTEFAGRSNASCKILKYESNVCWAECIDEKREKLAQVRVDMSSDCGREQVYYHRTVIKYYR